MGMVTLLAVRLALSLGPAGALLAAAALRQISRSVRRPDPGGALPLSALATAGYAALGVLLVLVALR
jgi:hypothetical protein